MPANVSFQDQRAGAPPLAKLTVLISILLSELQFSYIAASWSSDKSVGHIAVGPNLPKKLCSELKLPPGESCSWPKTRVPPPKIYKIANAFNNVYSN